MSSRPTLRLHGVDDVWFAETSSSPTADEDYSSSDEGDRDSLQTPLTCSVDHGIFHPDQQTPFRDIDTQPHSKYSPHCASSRLDAAGVESDSSLSLQALVPPDGIFAESFERQWHDAQLSIASNLNSLDSQEIDPFSASFGTATSYMRQNPPEFGPGVQLFGTQQGHSHTAQTSPIHRQALRVEEANIYSPPVPSRSPYRFSTPFMSPSYNFPCTADARAYSPRFPVGHNLNIDFLCEYNLEEELGAGGYGLVMTAQRRTQGYEVAVKFILKSKVPDDAWMEDEDLGKVPSEIVVLSVLEHDGIVKCLDLFQDDLFYYLVQELHGTPWVSRKRRAAAHKENRAIPASATSLDHSGLFPPPLAPFPLHDVCMKDSQGSSSNIQEDYASHYVPYPVAKLHPQLQRIISSDPFLSALSSPDARPSFSRRPSHDLFECIEQSKHKRLSETQARYIFSQVVDVVHYLDTKGVIHRDIKDENLVIDENLKVKLIDFGSVVIEDCNGPRPFYTLFYGTTAYASSEILLKKPYQARPAEIWTLGVLLSFLLTGSSPFHTEEDAIKGRIALDDETASTARKRISENAMHLIRRCLEVNPETRADIIEVMAHPWLRGPGVFFFFYCLLDIGSADDFIIPHFPPQSHQFHYQSPPPFSAWSFSHPCRPAY